MAIWSAEIKELEKFYESLKGQLPDLEKELTQLIHSEDANVILLYSRRCLEVIITDLCECELKRDRGTEPLKGIIDKLNKEKKIPLHIIASMHGLIELSTYGAHPKNFDPEQVKPVLINLDIIIKWYLKYKEAGSEIKTIPSEDNIHELKTSENVKKSKKNPKKRLLGIVTGLMLLIVLVFAGLLLIDIIGSGRQTIELEKSIAVLPFRNDSPEPNEENIPFINGLMEEILINLQMIKELRVLGRTSVEQYRNISNKSIPEIARELGVNYIIEGSCQKYGNKFRLRVQLIRAKSKEAHLWAKSYEQEIRGTNDIFNIQNQIAEAVATELKAIITPDEKQLIDKKPTGNLTAYDFYRRGREEYLKYFVDNTKKEALEKAFSLFNEALKNDSTLAEAIVGLAQVYWGKHYWDSFLSDRFLDSVMILSNIAQSYNNELSDVYVLKGDYYREMEMPEQAIAEYDKAIKLNPNDYSSYFGKAQLYYDYDLVKSIHNLLITTSLYRGSLFSQILRAISGAFLSAGFDGKAKNYLQEALKLDGDSISNYRSLANIEFCLENYESSLEFLRKELELDTSNFTILSGIGEKYMFLGKYEESLKYYKSWLKRSKSPSQTTLFGSHRIGWAYWMNGDKKKADFYFNEQIKYCLRMIEMGRVYGNNARVYYDLAGVYAFRGDKKKVYETLENYNNTRQNFIMSLWSVSYIKNDPLFENMRNEPDFQQAVRDIEAKYQAEHERVRKWLEEQGEL